MQSADLSTYIIYKSTVYCFGRDFDCLNFDEEYWTEEHLFDIQRVPTVPAAFENQTENLVVREID